MMRMPVALAGLLMLALAQATLPQAVAADAVPRLTALRHSPTAAGVRLIFDIDPVSTFTVFTLKGPDRVVVDFPAIDWRLEDGAVEAIPQIVGMRYGLFRPDRARMILSLAAPMRVASAFTKPAQGAEPGRLVIDLAPASREEFDAAAGAPENSRWRGEAPPPPTPRKGDLVIAIDPGHGGIDPGASVEDVHEKTVVLAFAKVLAAEIDSQPGFSAFLVRDSDQFVPLAERVRRAHGAGANVLISIHADSVEEGMARGMSIYTLSDRGTDQAAEAFAARENRTDVLAGADLMGESDELTRLLVELAQRGTQDESRKLGQALIAALGQEIDLLHSRPLRMANFRVLKAPDIPSVLLELGFLDSPVDRARLTDPKWRDDAARGVVAGLLRWRETASRGFLSPRASN